MAYRCIVKDRGHFQMEDWLHFWETFSPYLLRGNVLPAPFKEMCELLRAVIVWHFRARSSEPGPLQYSTSNRARTQQQMWRYAQLVEEVCTAGPELCNLASGP